MKHSLSQEEKFKMMTDDPLPSVIIRLAIPTMISMLVTAFYNMADTFFVGQISTSATAVSYTHLIHSVDSLRLAEAIEAESAKKDCITDILLEVNVAQEESKFGFSSEELLKEIDRFADFPHIRVKGLMTIAPYVEKPEENRIYFAKLKQLSVDITAKKVNNVTMSIFSMGMTNDYEVAIEEGATLVRVGTGIFGERNYDRT